MHACPTTVPGRSICNGEGKNRKLEKGEIFLLSRGTNVPQSSSGNMPGKEGNIIVKFVKILAAVAVATAALSLGACASKPKPAPAPSSVGLHK